MNKHEEYFLSLVSDKKKRNERIVKLRFVQKASYINLILMLILYVVSVIEGNSSLTGYVIGISAFSIALVIYSDLSNKLLLLASVIDREEE